MLTRRALLALPALLPAPLWAGARPRFALILVERAGCAGCHAFRQDLPDYAQTALGQIAPLTRVDIDHGRWPEGLVLGARPRLTPTFLLLRDGVEIARILGYAGRAPLLDALGAALKSA